MESNTSHRKIIDASRMPPSTKEGVNRSSGFRKYFRSSVIYLILFSCLIMTTFALRARLQHQFMHQLTAYGGGLARQASATVSYRRQQQKVALNTLIQEFQKPPQEKKQSADDGESLDGGSATSGRLFTMKRINRTSKVVGSSASPSNHSSTTASSASALISLSSSTSSSSSHSSASSSAPTPYPINTHWAVITSIFEPSELIHQLVDLPGWCTVVVGDLKGPEMYNGFDGKCLVYLTPAMQESLPYLSLKFIKWNHFSRKNIGYIFAMHHGASVIYDTDDDNMLKRPDLLQAWTGAKGRVPASFMLSGSGTGLINPYPMFLNESLHYVYPRGFPLDSVKDMTTRVEHPRSSNMDGDEEKQECSKVAIVQSLTDVDPDVDAISRLAVPNVPFNFTEAHPPKALILNKLAFSPWNAQATLFFKEAFSLLLLPSSVHGRVSDIWRSYFALHVMLDSPDMCMAFSTPWVYQQRNAHTYLADFNSEIPLYQRATELVRHLAVPKRGRLLDLYADMYEYGIIEEDDVRLAEAWEQDLADVAKVVSKRQRHDGSS